MKKLLTLGLLILVVNTVFAQYQWEKVVGVKGGYGADSTITSVVENEKSTGNTKVILRTPSDSTFLNQNPDTSELYSTNPFVVRPPFVVENNLQIKSGSPGSGKVLTSDGSGNVSWTNLAGGSTILFYSLTYAQAEDSIALESLIKGAYYAITDKNVILVADNDTVFSLYGTYVRSGTEFNACLYDFSEDLVIYEETKNNDKVGASSLALTYGLVDTDPRTVYKFSDAMVLGNYVVDGTFNNSTSTGQVFFNDVTKGGIVTLSGDGNLTKSSILGGLNATSFTGDVVLMQVGGTAEVDISGSSGTFTECVFDKTTVADFTGFTGTATNLSSISSNLTVSGNPSLTGMCINYSIGTISGTASLNRAKIRGGSTVTISNGADFENSDIKACKVIATGGSAKLSWLHGDTVSISDNVIADGLYLAPFSDYFATGNAESVNTHLFGGNRLTLSDSANATSVSMYTGAQAVVKDNAFIEGLILRNVSDCVFEDDVICSPGEIENQSTVRLSGTGNYGNALWKRVYVIGEDSVIAVNCHFYDVSIRLDSAADIRDSYIAMGGTGKPIIYYNRPQPNQYVTTERSTKDETVYIQTDTLDFRHDSLYHWAGHLHVTVDDTINTITGLEAAPKYFRLYPQAGTQLVLDKSTETNITFPKSYTKVVADGSFSEFIELWHDGVNVHVMPSSFATLGNGIVGGEMGCGDSTFTLDLTVDTWEVVTNPAQDLLSEGAITLYNFTYRNDSLIADISATGLDVDILVGITAGNSKDYSMGLYRNGSLECTCVMVVETENNDKEYISYNDYIDVEKSDVFQVVIKNLTDNTDVEINSVKITIN